LANKRLAKMKSPVQ